VSDTAGKEQSRFPKGEAGYGRKTREKVTEVGTHGAGEETTACTRGPVAKDVEDLGYKAGGRGGTLVAGRGRKKWGRQGEKGEELMRRCPGGR